MNTHQQTLPRESVGQSTEMVTQQCRLRDLINELRSWLYEVEQLGIPRFGETGYRLRNFRQSLFQHFQTCRRDRSGGMGEVSEQESERLLDRLDRMINQLEMTDPPFDSWQQVIRTLNEFSDDLDSLESRLMNGETTSTVR
jgi:hypothetical protein